MNQQPFLQIKSGSHGIYLLFLPHRKSRFKIGGRSRKHTYENSSQYLTGWRSRVGSSLAGLRVSQAISKDFRGGQGSAVVWLPLLGNSIHYNRAVEFPLDLDRLAGWLAVLQYQCEILSCSSLSAKESDSFLSLSRCVN